jgi:pimeloyl-ACP methyl ester carboxylesterase
VGTASVGGLTVSYELVHPAGAAGEADGADRTWVITPGGRFSKDDPGLREMAEALTVRGDRALIWDRPNCGASDVCFEGVSESEMQADALAGLVDHLGLGPAVLAGGSGGARVSLLAAARHPGTVAGVALWWITGRPLGLLSLAMHYCAGSLKAAWDGGMEAVVALPEWAEVLERNPSNRGRFLAQDPQAFIATMERWMTAYAPGGEDVVPGLPADEAGSFTLPALVFRSGASDANHTRATSEQLAQLLPNARMVEPPWGDDEWNQRSAARPGGQGEGLFAGWPALAPILHEWAAAIPGARL